LFWIHITNPLADTCNLNRFFSIHFFSDLEQSFRLLDRLLQISLFWINIAYNLYRFNAFNGILTLKFLFSIITFEILFIIFIFFVNTTNPFNGICIFNRFPSIHFFSYFEQSLILLEIFLQISLFLINFAYILYRSTTLKGILTLQFLFDNQRSLEAF